MHYQKVTFPYHTKKVIFYNINGFWNDLLDFLGSMKESKFARRPLENFYFVANNLEELIEYLK